MYGQEMQEFEDEDDGNIHAAELRAELVIGSIRASRQDVAVEFNAGGGLPFCGKETNIDCDASKRVFTFSLPHDILDLSILDGILPKIPA